MQLTELLIPRSDQEVDDYKSGKIRKGEADARAELAVATFRQEFLWANRHEVAQQRRAQWSWRTWMSWHGLHPVMKVISLVLVVTIGGAIALGIQRGLELSARQRSARAAFDQKYAEAERTMGVAQEAIARDTKEAQARHDSFREDWAENRRRMDEEVRRMAEERESRR